MKKYRVLWWEERIVRKSVDIEAVDEWEAADKAMDGEIGESEVYIEDRGITDSEHIETTLIKEKIDEQ